MSAEPALEMGSYKLKGGTVRAYRSPCLQAYSPTVGRFVLASPTGYLFLGAEAPTYVVIAMPGDWFVFHDGDSVPYAFSDAVFRSRYELVEKP
mgnify:CR=1 FL=1